MSTAEKNCEIRFYSSGYWSGSRFLVVRIKDSGLPAGKAWLSASRPETTGQDADFSEPSDDNALGEPLWLTTNMTTALWKAMEKLPTSPTSTIRVGSDGTYYLLEFESDGFLMRYNWWSSLPAEWSDLSVVIALLEGVTISHIHLKSIKQDR